METKRKHGRGPLIFELFTEVVEDHLGKAGAATCASIQALPFHARNPTLNTFNDTRSVAQRTHLSLESVPSLVIGVSSLVQVRRAPIPQMKHSPEERTAKHKNEGQERKGEGKSIEMSEGYERQRNSRRTA